MAARPRPDNKRKSDADVPSVLNQRDSVLANVALLYYGEGLTQSEIAKRMKVSRATVINQLRESRELGIVDIRIRGEALAVSSLSRALCERFGLDDAYVAYGAGNGAALLRNTARVAAMAVLDIIEPGDQVGVSWGETLKSVADSLPSQRVDDVAISQVIGSMDTARLPAAETCAIRIANRLHAHCYTLHAPARLSTEALAKSISAEPAIKRQLARFDKLDLILYSIGDVSAQTHLVASDIATAEELRRAIDNGACGIACGRYYDRGGAHVSDPLDDRLIAITIKQLKAVPKRFLVAAGRSKRTATLAALAGGMVSHLCVDQELAEWLLEALVEEV